MLCQLGGYIYIYIIFISSILDYASTNSLVLLRIKEELGKKQCLIVDCQSVWIPNIISITIYKRLGEQEESKFANLT